MSNNSKQISISNHLGNIDLLNQNFAKLEAAIWGSCCILEEAEEERSKNVSLGLFLTFKETSTEWEKFHTMLLREARNEI